MPDCKGGTVHKECWVGRWAATATATGAATTTTPRTHAHTQQHDTAPHHTPSPPAPDHISTHHTASRDPNLRRTAPHRTAHRLAAPCATRRVRRDPGGMRRGAVRCCWLLCDAVRCGAVARQAVGCPPHRTAARRTAPRRSALGLRSERSCAVLRRCLRFGGASGPDSLGGGRPGPQPGCLCGGWPLGEASPAR